MPPPPKDIDHSILALKIKNKMPLCPMAVLATGIYIPVE